MKTYTPPAIRTYGDISAATADTRENDSDDVFFSLNGPMAGLGGSADTCVTPDNENCL